MINFQKYVKATSLEEAYTLNQQKNNRVLGGMLWMRLGTNNYNTVIDLTDLGLNKIEENDSEFKIGAMVTLRDFETNEGLEKFSNGAIKDAVKDIIGVQFRNLATVGGSIWGRFGFSDILTVLLAFDSYVELYKGGIVPLDEFSKMPYDRDILVSIIIKKKSCKCVYDAVRIQRTDFPVLTCAASLMDNEVRISIGARPARALLYKDSNEYFSGGITKEAISNYVDKLIATVPTESNNRGTAEYRSKLVGVLASRNLSKLGGLV